MSVNEVIASYYHTPPSFRDGNTNWNNSVYYWWWEYLRQNVAYKAYCKTLESKDHECFNKLYADFGDVYQTDFKTWYGGDFGRGWDLFSEHITTGYFGIAWNYEDIDKSDFDQPSKALYIRVPTKGRTEREAIEHIKSLLKFISWNKPGQRVERHTKVKYPVLGRPNVIALKRHLVIHKFRVANADMALWRIAQELKLFHEPHYLMTTPDLSARNIMSATVSRHLKKANALIHNVGLGRFPDYVDREAKVK
jgi:hypothetical protein